MRTAPCLISESGDTLIEVIISAVLIAFVVIAILTGLDSANRSTSLQRARSQADALAQQSEDELRAEPVNKLSELEREKTVKEGNTNFKIVTTAKYKEDATGTASCTSSSAKADYLETISTVTSPLLGTSKGKPREVVETGIISPPADSSVIVQVQESGTALPGAKVAVRGPAPATTPYELETSTNGCAIIALPSGGEYSLNVSKEGYVDPNGYANTEFDSSVTRSLYIPAETTAKAGYNLGHAGQLEVSFKNAVPPAGDSFVIFNTGMTAYRKFESTGGIGSYESPITTLKPNSIFPFATPYTVYAGTCPADLPTKNGQSSNPEVTVAPGLTAKVTVSLPPINVTVMKGTKSLPVGPLQSAIVRLEDTGCGTVRTQNTNISGALPNPGMPFGVYALCVSGEVGIKKWKYTGSVVNNSESGLTETVYLGESKEETKVGCP